MLRDLVRKCGKPRGGSVGILPGRLMVSTEKYDEKQQWLNNHTYYPHRIYINIYIYIYAYMRKLYRTFLTCIKLKDHQTCISHIYS